MARYFPVVPNWLYFLLSLPIGVIFLTFIITLLHEIISFGIEELDMNNRPGWVRISIHFSQTKEEIMNLVESIKKIVN